MSFKQALDFEGKVPTHFSDNCVGSARIQRLIMKKQLTGFFIGYAQAPIDYEKQGGLETRSHLERTYRQDTAWRCAPSSVAESVLLTS
jgi:hypothetical protein